MAYDSKCFDLAEIFLEDGLVGLNHKERVDELAQLIQTTIEDWIESNPPQMEKKVGNVTILASERR